MAIRLTAGTVHDSVVLEDLTSPRLAGASMGLIGYARVSTDEPTTAPRLEPLRAACTVIPEQ